MRLDSLSAAFPFPCFSNGAILHMYASSPMFSFFIASREQSPVNGPLFPVGLRPNPSALRNKLRECKPKGSDFMYIKLYLSEQEKQRLEEIAERRKMSVSKLCYEQVVPLFLNPLAVPETSSNTNDTGNQKYDNCVKVYFTDDEFDYMVEQSPYKKDSW